MSIQKKRKLDRCQEFMTPVLADELIENTPLTKVYVASILDPKNTSKIVVDLNAAVPIQELTHLKRVKKQNVILFPVSFCEEYGIRNFLIQKSFPVDLLESEFKVLEVAKIPPRTRKQYDAVNALWPCNFHSNKYLEKVCTNTLFNDEEQKNHERYMTLCVEVAKYGRKLQTGKAAAAIVVDPKINSIVAAGYNESISNPSMHEVMTAIDNVAKTQNGGVWNLSNSINSSDNLDLRGLPEKLLEHFTAKGTSIKFGATSYKGKSEIEVPSDGPYLCTNYDVYVTHEPCIMCAMALIHSRIRRVFYGIKTANGGLGSTSKIHVIKNLNHHYEVFSGLLENECSLLDIL